MSSETERAVYVQRIAPGQKEAYLEAHANVPAGVTQAMEDGGVTEFELYVRDDLVVCVLAAEDIDAYLSELDGNEAVDEWERYVGQFKSEGVDVDRDEMIPFMKRIWTLEDGLLENID